MALPSVHKCLRVSGDLGSAGPRGCRPSVRPAVFLAAPPSLDRASVDCVGVTE